MRLVFAVLSPIFLLLCVVAIHGEETGEWRQHQDEFNRLYAERANAKLAEAQARGDAAEAGRWTRVAGEVAQLKPEIKQNYIAELGVADRCTSCHLGIDNPLFADVPQPYRSHSGKLLESHEPGRFGCTMCHDGQGSATSTQAAHGNEPNWPRVMMPSTVVQSACSRCHEVAHGLVGGEAVSRGADMFMNKGCYACHNVPGAGPLPKFAPPLNNLKSKLTDAPAWVGSWIKEPARVAPDTAMPNFLLSDEETGKITAFLLTLGKPATAKPVVVDASLAENGKKLFTERGCRGCHGVEKEEHSVSPRVPHLGEIGSKVTPEWLDAWIADPKQSNPDTAMPKIALENNERGAIVAYLMSRKRTEPLPRAADTAKFDVAEGKELVKQYECFGCHAIDGFQDVRPSVPDLGEFARRPVAELDFGTVKDLPRTKWDWMRRKFREPRAYEWGQIKLRMPVNPLTDDEVNALMAYSMAMPAPSLPASYLVKATPASSAARTVSWMVGRLNCNGCHRLDGKDANIATYFERKSRVGPTLDGVGGRLQGQYLYGFLMEPKPVRPWLTLRMPTFGFTQDQSRALVDGFAARAHTDNPYTYVAKSAIDKEHFERGIRRFRHYKCIQCHPSAVGQALPEGVDPDDLSINLMLSKERLRPEWFAEFLARPKQIAGNDTRMPTVFYTVEGAPKVERPEDDIKDIVTYVMGMTEDAEITLKVFDEEEKAEQQKEAVDWSKVQY
ncbi:MAG: c-type cytochrome [Deltaproteobacteria bacterium]|nr:c-type cytochrome [Deltaproteobacteria bacterium]